MQGKLNTLNLAKVKCFSEDVFKLVSDWKFEFTEGEKTDFNKLKFKRCLHVLIHD